MGALQTNWEAFEKKVLPADASEYQRRDMKMAFVAGFYWALVELDKLSEDEVPEDAAVARLQELHVECADLIKELTTPPGEAK